MNPPDLMTVDEMRQHKWSVSWSGGKDSTATILLMRKHKIPIERIIYVRMMWDDTLPATLPVMTDFVDRVSETFRAWGYKVDIVPSLKTAVELRDSVYKKSSHPELNGHKYGVLAFYRGYCRFSGIKQKTIQGVADKDAYQMIGYRADEKDRIHRLGGRHQSIMVALGVTGEEARRICLRNDMLSPLYGMHISRDGCWFCPNAGKSERENLRENHPELVALIDEMIEMSRAKLYDVTRNEWVREYDYYRKYQQIKWKDVMEEQNED